MYEKQGNPKMLQAIQSLLNSIPKRIGKSLIKGLESDDVIRQVK